MRSSDHISGWEEKSSLSLTSDIWNTENNREIFWHIGNFSSEMARRDYNLDLTKWQKWLNCILLQTESSD